MSKALLRCLMLIPLSVLASVANANIVTFGEGPGIFADGYTEDGMTIATSSVGFARIVNWQGYAGGDVSQTSGEREILDNDGAAYTFSLVSGGNFDLLSIDIEDPVGATAWSAFGTIDVVGSNGASVILNATTFGTQAFGATFIGISSFSIFFDSSSQATFDNINFAVPIPAAVWLFGSAMLGLLGLKRRTIEPVR